MADGAGTKTEYMRNAENPGAEFDALLDDLAGGSSCRVGADGGMHIRPTIIGWVHSPLEALENCPDDDTAGPEAALEILPAFTAGLEGLALGQDITVLTWLHTAERKLPPLDRSGASAAHSMGVFAGKGKVRPNPIGLHRTRVLSIEKTSMGVLVRVDALSVPNCSPLLDIRSDAATHYGSGADFFGDAPRFPKRHAELLAKMCHSAWEQRLLAGFNGSASLRLGDYCLFVGHGTFKQYLQPSDFSILHIPTGDLFMGRPVYSAAMLHRLIYREQPSANSILLSHPRNLLALSLRLPETPMHERLHMHYAEALHLRERLAEMDCRGVYPTESLPEIVARVAPLARDRDAIWLEGVALITWGINAPSALALAEELEQAAAVRVAG